MIDKQTRREPVPCLKTGGRQPNTFDAPVVALTHVRVIDGTGAAPTEDQTVVLANGRIQAIGGPIPPDAKLLDLTGHTVLPGLVMVHEHLFYPAGDAVFHEMAYSFPRLYLAAGVEIGTL